MQLQMQDPKLQLRSVGSQTEYAPSSDIASWYPFYPNAFTQSKILYLMPLNLKVNAPTYKSS